MLVAYHNLPLVAWRVVVHKHAESYYQIWLVLGVIASYVHPFHSRGRPGFDAQDCSSDG